MNERRGKGKRAGSQGWKVEQGAEMEKQEGGSAEQAGEQLPNLNRRGVHQKGERGWLGWGVEDFMGKKILGINNHRRDVNARYLRVNGDAAHESSEVFLFSIFYNNNNNNLC